MILLVRLFLFFVLLSVPQGHAADDSIARLEAHFSSMTNGWVVPSHQLKIKFEPVSDPEKGPPIAYLSSVSLVHQGKVVDQQLLFVYPASYCRDIFENKDRTMLEWIFRTVVAYPGQSVVAFLKRHPEIVAKEFSEVFARFEQMVDTVARTTPFTSRSPLLERYSAACDTLRAVANTDLKILSLDNAEEDGIHRHVIKVGTPRRTSFAATMLAERKNFGSAAAMHEDLLKQFVRLAADNIIFRPLFARDSGLEDSAFYVPGLIGNCESFLLRQSGPNN